ncbi:Maf family protein [Paenibacillus sp. GCM10023252]|uniref:Maf family protein n=1 Tax=Paenibacillus sp. GCM10023252 TaxID=3252649 RepID=UPI0036198CEB
MTSSTESFSQLVLASSSPRRQELVASLGLSLPVRIMSTNADETIAPEWTPQQAVQELGLLKARAASAMLDKETEAGRSLILGADTIVVLDDDILGKPSDVEEAVSMLQRLQGRIHHVYTGVALAASNTGEETSAYRMTQVMMKPLTLEQIRRYVDTGEPMDKAGAYGIQGLGGVLIERIEGCYFNVVGLPLSLLSDMLAEQGVRVI